MSVWEIILGVVMLLLSLVIVFAVIMQQGRRSGINGAISGGADTFLSKNKARTVDAVLARYTKWLAVGFFIISLVANYLAIQK